MTSTQEYEKALLRLEEALRLEKNDIVRDSVIQRFESTFELAWKTSKRLLGLRATAPRVVIREMAQQGMIHDPEVWFEYLESRNLSAHAYIEDLAEKVYADAQGFTLAARDLLVKLKEV